ncbi:hypothetical protein F2P81_022861 [Scophthalmus maximus]|uniref:Uncharacterized protein n=1 Tax=Scophthalmus maximus TaxID=52904 RepID=A0A6A4S2U2_SCOMX|nr:hypothetical protein F2P81_022861 [Scophthalmus maximus]
MAAVNSVEGSTDNQEEEEEKEEEDGTDLTDSKPKFTLKTTETKTSGADWTSALIDSSMSARGQDDDFLHRRDDEAGHGCRETDRRRRHQSYS